MLVSRRSAILSVLVLAACSNQESAPPRLPPSASFGWQLQSLHAGKPESAPPSVRAIGFGKVWRAEYGGPGTAHVDLYQTKSEASGLEMMQKWRAAADTVALFNNHYFVVISWEKAERPAITALLSSLEKALKEKG